MRNPEERSPQEWANDLRIDTGCDSYAREFTRDDCDELAQRMDDLAEALRLLRVERELFPKPSDWDEQVEQLLVNYEGGDDE